MIHAKEGSGEPRDRMGIPMEARREGSKMGQEGYSDGRSERRLECELQVLGKG